MNISNSIHTPSPQPTQPRYFRNAVILTLLQYSPWLLQSKNKILKFSQISVNPNISKLNNFLPFSFFHSFYLLPSLIIFFFSHITLTIFFPFLLQFIPSFSPPLLNCFLLFFYPPFSSLPTTFLHTFLFPSFLPLPFLTSFVPSSFPSFLPSLLPYFLYITSYVSFYPFIAPLFILLFFFPSLYLFHLFSSLFLISFLPLFHSS